MIYILIIIGLTLPLRGQDYVWIDTNTKFQTFSGWEASAFIMKFSDPSHDLVRDSIFKLTWDKLNVNRLRVEIRSGIENPTDHYAKFRDNGYPDGFDTNYFKWRYNRYVTINDNEDTTINWAGFNFTELDEKMDKLVIPYKKYIEERGGKLLINLCYVAFTSQIDDGIKYGYLPPGDYYIHDNPEEYAELVLASYLHLQNKYSIEPDTWEVLLEPDNVKQWTGRTIGMAMVAASERLAKWGFKPKFVAPSCTNMGNAISYFDEMVKVPKAMANMHEFSYHRYGGRTPENLQKIRQRAETWRIGTSMLEWWFKNSTYKVLYDDLINGSNSAWQGETLAGFFKIDLSQPTNPGISFQSHVNLNYQFMHNILPGSVRLRIETNLPNIYPALFRQPDGDFVFFIHGYSEKGFIFKNMPKGIYEVSYADKNTHGNIIFDNLIANDSELFIDKLDSNKVYTYKYIAAITSIEENNSDFIEIKDSKLFINNDIATETTIYSIEGKKIISTGSKNIDLPENIPCFYRIHTSEGKLYTGKILTNN